MTTNDTCPTCGEPYSKLLGFRSSICSNGFHMCRDCTWHAGQLVMGCRDRCKRCGNHVAPGQARLTHAHWCLTHYPYDHSSLQEVADAYNDLPGWTAHVSCGQLWVTVPLVVSTTTGDDDEP